MAIEKVDFEKFMLLSKIHPVLDVRSPGEFEHAHIPGSYNLPLFSNEERKVVGTAYKQQGRETAIKIGLDYFGVKMRKIVEEAEKLTIDTWQLAEIREINYLPPTVSLKTVLVHCWRGGMRSAAIAWLLDLYGFKVYTLIGGYKKFRNYVLEMFTQFFSFKIVGGLTGSGKTYVLHEMAEQGYRTIDLEALANHKGSAFGALGRFPQPSQEMFENLLALELRNKCFFFPASGPDPSVIDSSRKAFNYEAPQSNENYIWLEDESQRIGTLTIPQMIWKQMRKSPVYFLSIPFDVRLKHIEEEYGSQEKEKMAEAILRIQKRLGGQETKTAIDLLKDNNVQECFRILLKYYDKCYLKALQNRENIGHIKFIDCAKVDQKENFNRLKKALQSILTEHADK